MKLNLTKEKYFTHFVSVSYSYLSCFVFEDVYGYTTVNLINDVWLM